MSKIHNPTQEYCVGESDAQIAARDSASLFKRLRDRNNPYCKAPAIEGAQDFASRCPRHYGETAAAVLSESSDKFPNNIVLTLAAALAYNDAGFYVIDGHALDERGRGTGPGGQAKQPRGRGWQGRASKDQAETIAAWTGKGEYPPDTDGETYPFANPSAPRNVSIVTKEGSDLIVIDLDGPEGLAAWAALEEEHGAAPKTVESITGSGGRHLIFNASGVDIRNTASAIAPGVDVRGKNGHIVAPPSIHPNGNRYSWKVGCAPWECRVAEAPTWLVKLTFEATKHRAEADANAEKEVRAKRNAKGSGGRVSGLGFEGYIAAIGDGEGLRGFDGPIYSAALSYFATGGTDKAALLDTLRDAVLVAPCKDDRAERRYATDDYLLNRVEQAQEFIVAQTPETDLDQFEDPEDWLPPSYKIKRDTIYKATDEDSPDLPVCQRFDVVGRSSNLDGTAGAGRIIQFENENGETVELTLARSELYKDGGGDVISRLSDAGMQLFIGGKKSRDDLLNLLRQITPQRQIPTLVTPGWTRDRVGQITGYMLPTGAYMPVGDAPPLRLHEQASFKDKHRAGTLEGSKIAANAAMQSPNFYWTLGLCIGFTGPLQTLIEAPSCGMNLSGESSLGKTLAEFIAAMLWGNPHTGKAGFFGMNTTSNAIEDLAVRSSGTVLCLDEIGQMNRPQDLSAALFKLSSGTGKARKNGGGLGLVDTAEFQVFVLLSNEHSLKDTIEGAGGKYKTGLSVRFPDVDVTGGVKVSADVLAKLDQAKTNFGHMGPAFVQYLIDQGWINRVEDLKKIVGQVADKIAGRDAAPATRRAAQVFALARVAGELAVDAGLIEGGMIPNPRHIKEVREGKRTQDSVGEVAILGKRTVRRAVREAFKRFKGSVEGEMTKGTESMLDGLRSYIARNMGRTIIPAQDAADGGYRDVLGWYTPTHVIFAKDAISDVSVLGLRGKTAGLLDALDEVGALEKSGKNRAHNSLPAEVDIDGSGDKRVPNYRIARAALGV